MLTSTAYKHSCELLLSTAFIIRMQHSNSKKTVSTESTLFVYVNALQSILYLSMPSQWLVYKTAALFRGLVWGCFSLLSHCSRRVCFVSLTWCLRHSVNIALELKHSVALSMVMTRWQSKTQAVWADSYGSPSHMTECLIAIATASCFILHAASILVSLEHKFMNISKVPACDSKDKFQLKEKSLCIRKT